MQTESRKQIHQFGMAEPNSIWPNEFHSASISRPNLPAQWWWIMIPGEFPCEYGKRERGREKRELAKNGPTLPIGPYWMRWKWFIRSDISLFCQASMTEYVEHSVTGREHRVKQLWGILKTLKSTDGNDERNKVKTLTRVLDERRSCGGFIWSLSCQN